MVTQLKAIFQLKYIFMQLLCKENHKDFTKLDM